MNYNTFSPRSSRHADRRRRGRALDDIYDFLGRFVAYPSAEAQIAHVLWIAHAHLMEAWESTPRIAFLSPEPGSGKTRALEITELLVPRPVSAVNVSPAYSSERLATRRVLPTILFDEIDTVFGPKAKENEEIRGLLNAGHRRGAVAGRCVVRGATVMTEEIPAYCAVALAGIGDLPDTILTRSVIVKMRRRGSNEMRRAISSAHTPRRKVKLCVIALRIGAARSCGLIGDEYPELPHGIQDRDADVWEPLMAVADAAGDEWPDQARVAAVTLVTLLREANPSLGVRLLADLRTVFEEAEAKSTAAILTALHDIDEAPWGDIRGKPLDDRGLARRLVRYGIKPKVIRIGEGTARGYVRADLHDAWDRYLGPSPGRA